MARVLSPLETLMKRQANAMNNSKKQLQFLIQRSRCGGMIAIQTVAQREISAMRAMECSSVKKSLVAIKKMLNSTELEKYDMCTFCDTLMDFLDLVMLFIGTENLTKVQIATIDGLIALSNMLDE
jgi:hypothetical protein